MPTVNPRLNVTITPEQHGLLLELARLNGGSAAGYLRQMLDQATPLLRATVPALRSATQEMNSKRAEATDALTELFHAIREVGVDLHPDLLDAAPKARKSLGASAPSVSEGGRAKASRKSK